MTPTASSPAEALCVRRRPDPLHGGCIWCGCCARLLHYRTELRLHVTVSSPPAFRSWGSLTTSVSCHASFLTNHQHGAESAAAELWREGC